ncbi:CoA-binding protein, partial [Streptomyces cacaoi]
PSGPAPEGPAPARRGGPGGALDEYEAKQALSAHGVPTPRGAATGQGGDGAADEAAALAATLGFPVVVKALSPGLAHKSEVGGVRTGLADEGAVREAVAAMAPLADRFLIERMVPGAVAELVVGVRHDPRFGRALTLGSGGVLVELVRDTATLLLPASRAEIEETLGSLRAWPVLRGFRAGPAGDVAAAVEAVSAVAAYAQREDVTEVEVNPLLVLPEGHGAVAVDAVVRYAGHEHTDENEEVTHG